MPPYVGSHQCSLLIDTEEREVVVVRNPNNACQYSGEFPNGCALRSARTPRLRILLPDSKFFHAIEKPMTPLNQKLECFTVMGTDGSRNQ